MTSVHTSVVHNIRVEVYASTTKVPGSAIFKVMAIFTASELSACIMFDY